MAYTEFVNALEQDGHFDHVVEALKNTQLTQADLETTASYSLQSMGHEAIHQEVDKLYERIQRGRSARNQSAHGAVGKKVNSQQKP